MKSITEIEFRRTSRYLVVVMPVKTGSQAFLKSWIPGRASYHQLARNDNFFRPELRFQNIFLLFGEAGDKTRIFQLLHEPSID